MTINQITLNSSSVARVLGAAAFLLVLASVGGQLIIYLTGYTRMYALSRLFYVDAEMNIPSAFSTFLLLFAALLLVVITELKRRQADSTLLHWAILSCGFVFMAMDEAWSFHERLIKPLRGLLGNDNLGVFYFSWVIPGIALVLVLALFFLRFLLRLPAKTRGAFLIAAILYIGGTIGVELVGGRFAELYGTHNLTYVALATAEESLEMAGAILFIWALLEYLANNYREVGVRFE